MCSSRKVKQAFELADAIFYGLNEIELFLFPSERRYWLRKGLEVTLNDGEIYSQSSTCRVKGDFAKVI